jgi:hypothetical protein
MRVPMMVSTLMMALIGWTVGANGQVPTASAGRPLILIPTALQELTELRSNTGKRGPQRDGTTNDLYVKHIPAKGNVYLNFHVDVASEAGSFVLRAADIRLEAPAAKVTATPAARAKGAASSEPETAVLYAPMDWFIDMGQDEARGDSLAVRDKALLQFTIEVPRAGLDNLTLFVRSQRIGTIREIRARIIKDR